MNNSQNTTATTTNNNQIALDRYNAKWSAKYNKYTSQLYKSATSGKSAEFGCRLQDTVIVALGHDKYGNLLRVDDLTVSEFSFYEWMIEED
jgi:hypothetical protein